MKDSLWRQPYLIALTYGDSFSLVENSIRGRNLRVLEIGCGTGFMTLKLARMGHDVVGIDSNETIIRIAKRTMETDPYSKTRRDLRYELADFNKWSDASEHIMLFCLVASSMIFLILRRSSLGFTTC
jgi:SAM-dependent methyltransferase